MASTQEPGPAGLLPLPAPRTAGDHLLRLANAVGGWILRRLDVYFRRNSKVGQHTFFESSDFPWVERVEADWQVVRRELDELLRYGEELPNFQEISTQQAALTDDDRWKTVFLYGYGRKLRRTLERCPETARLLQQIPGMTTAMFSILAPGKRIPPHEGPYAGVLRYHLALLVPQPAEACGIRVGADVRHWQEGKSLVFDDVFEHEVWNDSAGTRAVLFVDFRRPLEGLPRFLNAVLLTLIGLSPFVGDAAARHRAWEERFENARRNAD